MFIAGSLCFLFFLWLMPSFAHAQTAVLTRAQFSRLSTLERAQYFEATIARIAAEEAVDPYLLWTIGYNETRFRPWLRSPAGAEGLMQFIPTTAARFNLANPYDSEAAIRAAARYVKILSRMFGGRIDSVLAAYNAGEGAVDAFLQGKTVRAGSKTINSRRIKTVGGVPPYRETQDYVVRGLLVYGMLRQRQIFPTASYFNVFPNTVSERAAKVRVSDREIGLNGSLASNFSIVRLSPINANQRRKPDNDPVKATVAEAMPAQIIVSENSQKQETAARGRAEQIYYEPRTGARYIVREDGATERLEEGGELVISSETRAPQGIRARGNFFGGKLQK